jgi:chaperonin cofactor prefoldin
MPDYSINIEKYTTAFMSLDKQVELLCDRLNDAEKTISDLQKKFHLLESKLNELQSPRAR